MHLEVTFKHLKPKEEIRRRADALFKKLERFLDPAAEGTLTLTAEHEETIVDFGLHAHGHHFQANSQDGDLRTAIDRAFHTMEKNLRRAKEKRVDGWQKHRPARADGFTDGSGDSADEQYA